MPIFQSSNIATYKTADGAPVFQTHFVEIVTRAGPCLIAFASEHLRQQALAVQAADGSERRAIKAYDAFMRIRAGEGAFLYEPDETHRTFYVRLELSRGSKGNWLPRVIQGGKVA
jgi:hypothetical protein